MTDLQIVLVIIGYFFIVFLAVKIVGQSGKNDNPLNDPES